VQTPALTERLTRIWETPHTLWGSLATVDHKVVGKRYIVTAIAFLLVGGLEAMLMRAQLTGANRTLLSPEQYDQIFTMHGVTLIFWYASPILSGFSNYLVPLMIGARDMAFPRLNALSYWLYALGGVVLLMSWFASSGPARAGWTAYPSRSSAPATARTTGSSRSTSSRSRRFSERSTSSSRSTTCARGA
jgi:heme/copper-type cytochrome/quinol oxidase subunit 1